LVDGGEIAALMYRGGEHPYSALEGQANDPISLTSWQGISEVPTSYSDKVKMGTYSYWLPASTRDT
jgi:hypothetical protein